VSVSVAQAQQATWSCTFEGHRLNRPGGQWLPNGKTYPRSGADYLTVRKAAFDACQADAARDGIDTGRISNGCVLTTCGDDSRPRREAPHVESTPAPSVSGRSVPPNVEYCEFIGGLWAPGRTGVRHFIANGRVYSSQKSSFAHQEAWDACKAGEPAGNDGCVNTGCKRGPAQTASGAGTTASAAPSAPPSALPTGKFEYYWRQVNGNWASAPVRTATQSCPHPSGLACDAAAQKSYLAGQSANYHRNGCNAAPIQISCVVQTAGYKPPPPPKTPPAPRQTKTPTSAPPPPAPAQSQTNQFCRVYADTMIDTNRQGRQRQCPAFTSADMNWQAHYDWCAQQSSDPVNGVRDEQVKLLKSCLAGPPTAKTGRPTGAYAPGERVVGRHGEWDLREHVRSNGSFERCTITMEKYKPVVWRVSYMDDNRFILSVPKPPELSEGTKQTLRYGVNRKWFNGEYRIAGGRTAIDITNTINEFSVGSDVRIPVGKSTYAVYFYSMPAAMNALKSCRTRFN
jgi:hypothetical protein